MRLKLFFYICLFCSCENKSSTTVPKKENNSKNASAIRDCILEHDTVFNSQKSIRYIVQDSFYTIKLRLNDIDTVLSFRFNCTVPNGLVPKFYSTYSDKICLLRGYGNDFREFIIAYISGGKILLKEYETALAVDLGKSIVVYQSYDHPEKIVIEHIESGIKKELQLSSGNREFAILSAVIIKEKLILKLKGGKQTELKLSF